MAASMDNVRILRHLLIKDVVRFGRNMSITPEAARFLSQTVTEIVYQIQDNMSSCHSNSIKPLNPFSFLLELGSVVIALDAGITDAYLVRAVEDVYRRARVALYNQEPPDFNDLPSGGSASMPWAILDIDKYACKWNIDMTTATELCNWLLSIYELVKSRAVRPAPGAAAAPPVVIEFHAIASVPLVDVLDSFGTMTAQDMTMLAEDIYTRFRFLIIQYCSLTTGDGSALDYSAQLQLFYREQKKLQGGGD